MIVLAPVSVGSSPVDVDFLEICIRVASMCRLLYPLFARHEAQGSVEMNCRRLPAIAAALVFCGIFRANAAMVSSGDGYGFPYGSSVCADVAGGSTNPGTHIQSWPCHGGPNQQFAFERQQIFAMGGTLCLDVVGASTFPGTAAQVYGCNGTVAQNWEYSNFGQILYLNGYLCLDATSQASGTQLIVNNCMCRTYTQQCQGPQDIPIPSQLCR